RGGDLPLRPDPADVGAAGPHRARVQDRARAPARPGDPAQRRVPRADARHLGPAAHRGVGDAPQGDSPRVSAPETLPPLLEGVRVLALTHVLAGPYCTMLLADFGADVVKLERPGTGEAARTRGPAGQTDDGRPIPTGFLGPNRNKQSLTLDLKHE